MLRASSFFAACSLLAGIALQAFGFYFFLFFVTLLYAYHYVLGIPPARLHNARTQAYCAFALWFIFPLSNLLHQWEGMPVRLQQTGESVATATEWTLPLGALLSSPLNNAMLGFAFMLMLVVRLWWNRQYVDASLKVNKRPSFLQFPILQWFTHGLLIASGILLSYCMIQHLTGLDIYAHDYYIGDSKRLAESGYFRAKGFYSHPLTLAGVSLALFSFYWSLFWQQKVNPHLSRAALAIAVMHFVLVILSGSRTSIAVAAGLTLAIPLCQGSLLQRKLSRKSWFLLSTWSLASIALLSLSGVWTRYGDIFSQGFLSSFHRLKFWQVHWTMFADQPLFGHGSAWIADRVRLAYYDNLGFFDLEEKYNAHNIFLEILASIGLLGSLIMLGTLWWWWRTLRPHKITPSAHMRLQAFIASVASSLLHGLTQNTFFDSGVLYVYLYFLLIFFWERFFTLVDAEYSVPSQPPQYTPSKS